MCWQTIKVVTFGEGEVDSDGLKVKKGGNFTAPGIEMWVMVKVRLF